MTSGELPAVYGTRVMNCSKCGSENNAQGICSNRNCPGAPFDDEAAVAAGYHSPGFIQMFLGYMTAKLPQLKTVTEKQLLDLFAEFEETMAAKREGFESKLDTER